MKVKLKSEQYLADTLLKLLSPPTLAALSDQTPAFLFSPLKQKNEVY
jgi:hypothetical protein